jgi:ribosomal protein L29
VYLNLLILFHFQIQKYLKQLLKLKINYLILRFKKATRQSFKSHEIKNAKRRLAQLKTLLTLRLENLEQKKKI